MALTTSTPLLDEKRRLRRVMSERRAGLSAAERTEGSRAAVARLLALPAFEALRARVAAGGAASLSGYVALRGELDPAAALAAARGAGVAVALPRVDAAWPPRLRFHLARRAADLVDGPYGLTEPLASTPETAVEDLDLMLVPGLAFDAAGRRVGFGGGYYDAAGRRLREAGRGGLMVGFAFDFQVVDRCPADDRDIAVDVVVTDQRVLAAQEEGAP